MKKIAQLKTIETFRQRLAELGCELPADETILRRDQGSPLAAPLEVGRRTVGNRWCIHPMEGWDANDDGSPSPHTLRRWRRFGESGAKWIWGGEAAAVQPEGRANPHQTLATANNRVGLTRLLDELRTAHRARYESDDDLYVGLQLTHSGRFSRPTAAGPQPRIAYHHPVLDRRLGIAADDDAPVLSDEEIARLIDAYVAAAVLAQGAGFDFVDVKSCHGYLMHEFLGAHTRPGPYGGDFDGRTRLLTTVIGRIRDACP
ncbi:MAG: NADH:flavin oxidoreductase, partial [Planctomycetales bacterium]|nr:NADH:flavin oxidoreductase [Planctomycetales bacterium]